ncbi:MAG: TonB-dependent receptor [Fidelibacterota bacterium]
MKSFCVIALFLSMLFSQTKPIQGKVYSLKGEPLSDVNIISKPSGTGTRSNSEGEFEFEIPVKDRVFNFNHIGYESKSLDAIVFKNGTTIKLTPEVIELQPLDVTGTSRAQFDSFESKNIVMTLETDAFTVRGFTDIADALFSEQSVVLNESLNGQKSLSIRASSDAEMIYLYDGIRINAFGNPLFDLSLFSASGMSGIELVKGGHEKALSSSGTLNFIPKLTYGPSASFTQQFGTYNYGGYDGFGSLGFSLFSVNGGIGKGEFSQIYVDSEKPEIMTQHQRQFGHLGFKNHHNLDFRFLGFKNAKQFQNERTNDSITVDFETMIGKMNHTNPNGGQISFFGIFQSSTGTELTGLSFIEKDDINAGYGFSFEKPIQFAMIKFNGESNFLTSNWSPIDSTIITNRQNSIFTGSFELVQPNNDQKFQLKDVKIVLSKHLILDQGDTTGSIILDNQSWTESSSLFTASFLNQQLDKRIMIYANLGNVFRVPSLSERNSNRIHSKNTNFLGLMSEYKTSLELGMKVEKNKKDNEPYYDLSISGFSYRYSNKIKQIQLTGNPSQLPINFGDASLSGFDSYFTFSSQSQWFTYLSSYSYYIFSDPMAFQLQPDKLIRNTISLKIKWFQLDLTQRSESARQVTTINREGDYLQNKLEPINSYDMNLSFNLKMSDFNGAVSISGKNLGMTSQELNGISILDKRYTLNFGVSWK